MLTLYWIHLPEQDDPAKEGYVGITSNFERRMKEHKREAPNQYLRNVIDKYGWDNLIKEVIVSGPDDDIIDLEQVFRPKEEIGWNLCVGGKKPPINKGGRTPSEATKQKMREAKLGTKQSDETKQKRSVAWRGDKNPRFDTTVYSWFNKRTGEIISCTQRSLIETFGLHQPKVNAVVRGKEPSHRGWTIRQEGGTQ